MSNHFFTNSYNGYNAALSSDDNSAIAVFNVDTQIPSIAKDYFDKNTNQELAEEIFKIQKQVPFVTDVKTSDINYSSSEQSTQFVSTSQKSSTNTDNDTTTKKSPEAGEPPRIQESSGDFDEETGDRNFGSLIYPTDAQYSEGQDNLYIEQFSYKPPTSALFSQSFSSTLEGVQRIEPIEVLLGSVRLPIPDGISDQNTINWNNSSIGPGQAAAVNAATGIANAVGNIAQAGLDGGINAAISKTLESTGGGAKEITEAFKNPVLGDILRRQLISAATNAIGFGVTPEEILTRTSGRVTNKNLELLFTGQNLRQFSFAFQFAPRNNNEAQQVRKIIRFFKQGSAPKKSVLGSGGSAFFLKSPNVFRLSYRKGLDKHIKGLNKFKICACQGVGINYAPNGYASYQDDSQPVAVSMSISFTELTPLFYDDYEKPDKFLSVPRRMKEDDVGF